VVGVSFTPAATLPSFALAITHAALSADELAARLRAGEPAIITRVEDARVLLDLRTVFPEQDATVQAALLALR
jgi:L-seryl-tRNA(Ser) seleniumtransferase